MWAGGKNKQIDKLLKHAPAQFKAYHEPFVGSGSLFMGLKLNGKHVYLNDSNCGLMSMYAHICLDPKQLMKILRRYQAAVRKEYDQHMPNAGKAIFERVRAKYNKLKTRNMHGSVNYAAYFMIIITLSFCAIYRENKDGLVTSPYQAQTSSLCKICKTDRIESLHAYFSENIMHLSCTDFEVVLKQAKAGDFVYLDPPYWAKHIAYSSKGFDFAEQLRVCEVFEKLSKRGCKVMLSNSDTKEIRKLFKNHRIRQLRVDRTSHKNNDVIYEILVTNY